MENLENEFLKMNYQKLSLIKKDEYKEIYLGEQKYTKEKLIILEINLSNIDDEMKNKIQDEGIHLSKLKNPNLINHYEFLFEKDKITILKEYAEGGNLNNKIKEQKNKNEYFKEIIIIDYLIEICEGLIFINENNIIHEDLTLDNILLTIDNRIKLNNFGISKLLNKNKEKNNSQDDKKIIFNLGLILYELTQLENPPNTEEIKLNEKKEEENNNINNIFIPNLNYSSFLINILKSTLKPNPDITLKEILINCITEKLKNDDPKIE